MPEHLHVLLTPSRNQTLEACASCIKGGFFVMRRCRGVTFGIVARGFPEHTGSQVSASTGFADGDDFRKQLAHIAANPERRGLVYWDFVHTGFRNGLTRCPSG